MVDENELFDLLIGRRTLPVRICRFPMIRHIGALTEVIWLSHADMVKNEAKHKAFAQNLYALSPIIIRAGEPRKQDERTAVFLYDGPERRLFKAAVRRTRDGNEVYLKSVHPIRMGDYRAIMRKTKPLY